MKYVIKKDNSYVTPAGSAKSYTNFLQKARLFDSIEEAKKQACNNEKVVSLEFEFGQGWQS